MTLPLTGAGPTAGLTPRLPITGNILYRLDASSIALSDGASVSASDWVDQSSHALGALQSIAGATYRASSLSKPCVELNGTTGAALSSSFTKPATHRIFMVTRNIGSPGGRLVDGAGSNNSGCILYANDGLSSRLISNSDNGLFVGGTEKTASFTVWDAIFNGASSTLQINAATAIAQTISAAQQTTGVYIGRAGSSAVAFPLVQIFEVIVCNSSLSVGDGIAIRAYLLAKYSANKPVRKIYGIGDSIMVGTGATGGNNFPTLLAAKYPVAVMNMTNAGESGKQLPYIDATEGPTADATLSTYHCTEQLIICEGGVNDIHPTVGNVDGPTAYSRITTLLGNRNTAGWDRIAACTIMPCTAILGSQETARQYYNTNLRANYLSLGADVLLDFETDSRLSDPTSVIYFSDGLHPTSAGYQAMADVAFAAIG